jgi:alkylation response protein AidB-like acyl-CoA dehydrogenase
MTTITQPVSDSATAIAEAGRISKLLADVADESAQLRRPADSGIEALQSAGLLRLTLPVSRGGARAPMATVAAVLAKLAEGDASVSWASSVYNAVGHMICAFGDEALDEFLASENPRSAGVFSVGGALRKVDGGYMLKGKWPFASGQHHAGWIITPGMPEDPSNGPIACLVPKSEFTVHDDWYVTGFVATGSNAVSLEETFVPEHRTIPFMSIVQGQYKDSSISSDPYYSQPFVPIMCAASVGTPIGLARAALRLFEKKIQNRAITYTLYTNQAEAAVTHLQLSEARMKLDQSEFHANRLIAIVDRHMTSGEPWDMATRVRCRADLAWAIKLAREVCEIVEHGSGASSIHTKDPLTRILRDIRAISVHSFMLHSTNAELYGRVLAGMEPGIPFV